MIRCSSAEHEELKRRAAAAGMPLSEWARMLLLGPAGEPVERSAEGEPHEPAGAPHRSEES